MGLAGERQTVVGGMLSECLATTKASVDAPFGCCLRIRLETRMGAEEMSLLRRLMRAAGAEDAATEAEGAGAAGAGDGRAGAGESGPRLDIGRRSGNG